MQGPSNEELIKKDFKKSITFTFGLPISDFSQNFKPCSLSARQPSIFDERFPSREPSHEPRFNLDRSLLSLDGRTLPAPSDNALFSISHIRADNYVDSENSFDHVKNCATSSLGCVLKKGFLNPKLGAPNASRSIPRTNHCPPSINDLFEPMKSCHVAPPLHVSELQSREEVVGSTPNPSDLIPFADASRPLDPGSILHSSDQNLIFSSPFVPPLGPKSVAPLPNLIGPHHELIQAHPLINYRPIKSSSLAQSDSSPLFSPNPDPILAQPLINPSPSLFPLPL